MPKFIAYPGMSSANGNLSIYFLEIFPVIFLNFIHLMSKKPKFIYYPGMSHNLLPTTYYFRHQPIRS